MTDPRRNWADRSRPLWRVGNRIEAFQLRTFGSSLMALANRGQVTVVETTGRRTGRTRFTPVGYLQDRDGGYVIGGGAAGMTSTPDWVANLRANPRAAIWIRRTRLPVIARELVGEEREAAQQQALAVWPGVAKYERRSSRSIPYFRLTPTD